MRDSRWSVHTATAAVDGELIALFAEVFGHPIALAQWQWKYAHAPVRGVLLRRNGGIDQGRVVAFFGGMPRTFISPEGLQINAVQNGDVMVLPSERGFFSRQGALHHIAAGFFSQQVGPGKTHAFAFGFPNGRHFQLGITLGLYAPAGRLSALSWSALSGVSNVVQYQTLGDCDSAPTKQAINQLFTAMRSSWPRHFIGERSAQRWQNRFVRHPVHAYTLLLVTPPPQKPPANWLAKFLPWQKPPAQPLCALVLREHPGHIEWLDFVGGREAIAPAVACVRDFAARAQDGAGKPVMALMSSHIAPDFALEAANCQPSDIFIPVNARPDEEALRHPRAYLEHLWLMGGDTDFL